MNMHELIIRTCVAVKTTSALYVHVWVPSLYSEGQLSRKSVFTAVIMWYDWG